MNIKLLKQLLTLITCLTLSSIAHGQLSSTDSITITREQQRKCIIWSKESILKDSIIDKKDMIIDTQRTFIAYTDTLIVEFDFKLRKSEENLKSMKKKRKNALIFGGLGTISAFFIGFFIKP